MKRHYILPLVLTLLLAGCGHDEAGTDNGGSSNSVDFSVEDIMSTRGSAISGTTFPTTASFRVFAWQTVSGTTTVLMTNDGTLLDNNVVIHTSAGWVPKYRYYWPDDASATASFYAVYPTDNTVTKSGDVVSLSFTVPADVSSQSDMMVAKRVNVTKSSGGAVSLGFNHLLSQVSFCGKMASSYSGWQVSVNSLTLCNVNSQGTYSYGTDAITPASPAALVDYQLVMSSTPIVLSSTSETTALTSTTDVAMLMPQTLTAWDRTTETSGTTAPVTSGCYLAVDCTITDAGSNVAFSGTIYVPIAGTWQSAQHYVYTLEFGCGYSPDGSASVNVSDVQVSCSIASWASQSLGSLVGTI